MSNILQKISELYNQYSKKFLLHYKIEPIALLIVVISYADPMSALKVYTLIAISTYMPLVLYRAYKKTIKKLCKKKSQT